ncbi:MAG: PIN domain-containing protein [Myxococcota bacterium]
MTARVFVDTNVLAYAQDLRDAVKQQRAHEWVTSLWRQRNGRVSAQVLNELYVTLTQRFRPGMRKEEARDFVRELMTWSPVPVDAVLVERAWSLQDRFSLSFWDALIVAAAHASGCTHLLSEDLQDGQDMEGVVVVNPFAHAPAELER